MCCTLHEHALLLISAVLLWPFSDASSNGDGSTGDGIADIKQLLADNAASSDAKHNLQQSQIADIRGYASLFNGVPSFIAAKLSCHNTVILDLSGECSICAINSSW